MLTESIIISITALKSSISSELIVTEPWFHESSPRICIGIEEPGGFCHIKNFKSIFLGKIKCYKKSIGV